MPVPVTTGQLKTQISNMSIGDYTVCNYVASSNAVGTFSNLGGVAGTEIPVGGAVAPSGSFYFVKVRKGLLIADRVIQNSISWDVLNTGKYIQGAILPSTAIPKMSANSSAGCVASASSIASGTYDAYVAFDKTLGGLNGWLGSVKPTTAAPQWLSIVLPQAITLKSYGVTSYGDYLGRAPKEWKLQAKVSSSWVDIDTQTNQVFINAGETATTTSVNRRKLYSISNPISANEYRILITDNNGDAQYVGIGELDFYTSDNPLISIRSLTGGASYADANGNMTLSDPLGDSAQTYGTWPTNNEYDRYLILSNLGGHITAADENVWHMSSAATWVRETAINNMVQTGTNAVNTSRIRRGSSASNGARKAAWQQSDSVATWLGFRPVLEYKEV